MGDELRNSKFMFKHILIWVTMFMGFVVTSVTLAAPELVVYSGRSDKFVKPVIEAFTKKSGIKVVLHNAKSTELINKLRLEGDKTPADLFISNDAGNLQVGSDLGLFVPVDAGIANVIDANYRASDNTWIGLSARARVLVVNTNEAQQLGFVKSVLSLADPRLRGKLAITHSSNGSYIAGVTVYQELLGDEMIRKWLSGMKSNVEGAVYNKHSKIVRDVAAGKKAIGLVNHYYIYRHLDKHPNAPISILLPDQGDNGMGVAWNVAGAAITKHGKQRKLAQQFMAFLTSEQGQSIFASVNREYPTRKGVDAAAEIPPPGSYKIADLPMQILGRKRAKTLDLIESVGMP